MGFDTAIFYDIENLMGGYAKAEMLETLSLKRIHQNIQKLDIGKISVQRAYANWSTPSLTILKDDIVELGINPVQMFGFGRGPDKNASDIHLVIDAMDIACHRPFIDNFIIVSGDGGFAPLAQQLHEYGKRVIGCSYKRITNRVLESVCDEFIWLEDPMQAPINTDEEVNKFGFTDSVLISYAKAHRTLANPNKQQFIKEGISIINFIADHRDTSIALGGQGLSISILIQAIKYRLGIIDYPKIGFERQLDFVNYLSAKSNCRLIVKYPSDYRLVYQKVKLKSFVDVEPIEEFSTVHTLENYKKVLAEESAPFIRLPKLIVLHDMVKYMIENPEKFQDVSYANMSHYLEYALDYSDVDIKNGLISFLATVAIKQDDSTLSFNKRRFTFYAENTKTAMQYLKNTMHEKLIRKLDSVDNIVFESLLSLDMEFS